MARADLHHALVLDREIYEASRVDASLLDPVVRVEGGLPGPARPILVLRDYQAPQGSYVEHFVLTDPTGAEVARSVTRRIKLTGEMFEDRFSTGLADVMITSGDEHRMTFFVNDEPVGDIPVFIEAGLGGDHRVAAETTFEKALNKSAVVWIRLPKAGGGQHTQAVWYVWAGGKVYVVDGPTEQHVPGLAEADQVELIARSKDLRSRVSSVSADVRVVPGDDPLFTTIGQAAMGRRLNLPDGEAALERWRARCTLLELTPRF